jgi:hypothetical protein
MLYFFKFRIADLRCPQVRNSDVKKIVTDVFTKGEWLVSSVVYVDAISKERKKNFNLWLVSASVTYST